MIRAEAVDRFLDDGLPAPDAVEAAMLAHAHRDRIPILERHPARVLEVLARAAGARRVVETGTAIGFSTLHLARAVGPGGSVVSFEVDADRHAAARAYLDEAGVGARVDLRLEDATRGLEGLDPPFDLAFIDAPKDLYAGLLDRAVPLLRPGGLLVADNVLMGGTVALGRPHADVHWSQEAIDTMRRFHGAVAAQVDLDGVVLPVGDGLLVAVRA